MSRVIAREDLKTNPLQPGPTGVLNGSKTGERGKERESERVGWKKR